MDVHLDAQAIAWRLKRPWSTVRWWAHKGWLTPVGKDTEGRKLYSYQQAAQVADTLAKGEAMSYRYSLRYHCGHSLQVAEGEERPPYCPRPDHDPAHDPLAERRLWKVSRSGSTAQRQSHEQLDKHP